MSGYPPRGPPGYGYHDPRRDPYHTYPQQDDRRMNQNQNSSPPHINTVFLKNVQSNVTDAELKTLCEEYGEVSSVFNKASERGIAFVTFFDLRAAERCVTELNGRILHDRPISSNFARSPSNNAQHEYLTCATVTTSVSETTTRDDVYAAFRKYGEIRSLEMGEKPCTYNIKYFDLRDAKKAVDDNGQCTINGQRVGIFFNFREDDGYSASYKKDKDRRYDNQGHNYSYYPYPPPPGYGYPYPPPGQYPGYPPHPYPGYAPYQGYPPQQAPAPGAHPPAGYPAPPPAGGAPPPPPAPAPAAQHQPSAGSPYAAPGGYPAPPPPAPTAPYNMTTAPPPPPPQNTYGQPSTPAYGQTQTSQQPPYQPAMAAPPPPPPPPPAYQDESKSAAERSEFLLTSLFKSQ